ncbi:MAG TPA: hypothetical protein VF384_10095 [Planctomycetota bacterium]
MLPTSTRGRLVLAGLVGSLSLLFGGAGVASLRATAAWATFCTRADELEGAVASRVHHRHPLWGSPREESAFAHYEEAGKLAQELDRELGGKSAAFCTKPDAELVAATSRPRWQAIAGAVHRGAHATDTTPLATSMLTDPKLGIFNLLWVRAITNATSFECRARLQEGRALDAVAASLDAATLALDVARRGDMIDQMIAVAALVIAMSPWTEARLVRMPADALAQLANGLERLDRAWPAGVDVDRELLLTARGLQSVVAEGLQAGPWQYAFSARWMYADAFSGYEKVMRELATVQPSWPRRAALLEVAFADEQARGNVLAEHCDSTLHSTERAARRVVADLRLLRMAIDRHLGRDLPPLRDPLGNGPIVVTRTADGTRLSCAADGERAVERTVVR